MLKGAFDAGVRVVSRGQSLLCHHFNVLAVEALCQVGKAVEDPVSGPTLRTEYCLSKFRRMRPQRYLTLFHDADQRRLLFATPGCNARTFDAFGADLQAHGGDPKALTDISMDISQGFQKGAARTCPQARITFDPFHVVALASEALDQVRRAEARHEPDLKGSRWALLKRPSNWNREQINTMHWLQRSGLKTARAWRLKEALRAIYHQCSDPVLAEQLLRRWIGWARRSRLVPFKRIGATFRDHLAGIVEHFRSGLSNGFVEAMNAQIQAAKARAKGYATTENMIAIAYLLCAKLRHLPRNPWLMPVTT